MKKQTSTSTIKKHSNWLAIGIAALVALTAFIPSGVALAWGPDRPTYTMAKPADHVTFNSITDNNLIGDERDFVRVREANTENKFVNEVAIEPGKEYEVYIAYHNNAAENLNSVANNGKGIALGTKVSTQFPTVVTPDQRGTVTATITAENSDPKSVWDEAHFTTTYSSVVLHYKTASAKIYNAWDTDESVLPQNLFDESGTYLGMNQLDGVLNGCFKFSGYVKYTLVAEQLNATLEKTVSKDGQNFYENITVAPGEEVIYKIVFKNTGNTALTNVGFRDELPDGLSLVDGTTYIFDKDHEAGEKLSDLITSSGYNLGKFGANTEATITYKAKVSDKAACGSLVNKMNVNHDNGELSDGATVTVEGCEKSTTPTSLPNTGPVEIVAAVIVVGGIGVAFVYYARSRAALKNLK